MSDADATPAFSDDERRALACVLDLLIPRSGDGRLPAAGELGIAAHIERVVRHDLGLRMTLAEGVAALAGADQLAALKQQAAAQPALLPGLIFHTYAGYYQAGQVLEGLGLEPRPPFPAGHVLEPFDATLLEPARRRGKLYRDA